MSTATARQHLEAGERFSAVPLMDGSEWYVVDWAAPDPPQTIETYPDQRAAEDRAEELNRQLLRALGGEPTRP